ncbi:MAG: choice-of-anchor V domain-containing protein, partial [Candidatus Thermoplasmatota archaeon]|nr:choice-of-anchor V domain-containing protein [Candidatus Thermoplasmatota archaeon]
RDLGLLFALLSAALLTGGSAFGYSGGGDNHDDDWAAGVMGEIPSRGNGCSCHNPEQSNSGMWSLNGFPVRYEPEVLYNLTLAIADSGVNDAAEPAASGGFLLRVTNGSFGGGADFWTSDDGSLLSHNANSNGQRNWTIAWTAPEVGAGDAVLTIYFNVVNGENGNDPNDAWSRVMVVSLGEPQALEREAGIHEMGVEMKQYWIGLIGIAVTLVFVLLAYIVIRGGSSNYRG